jgi:hypothetical protein
VCGESSLSKLPRNAKPSIKLKRSDFLVIKPGASPMSDAARPMTDDADDKDATSTKEDGLSSSLNMDMDDRVRAAERRLGWLKSPERARLWRFMTVYIGVAVLLALAGLLVYEYDSRSRKLAIGLALAAFFFAYIGVVVARVRQRQLRSQYNDRLTISEARKELRQAEEEVAISGATDFFSLWSLTQKRLDYYHRIATTQAERSFMYGQIAAGLGFATVLITAVIAAFARSLAASISAAVVGVSGGGLGAYIGATFMRSQDVSAAQMREYFRQPLEFSNDLAAERLLGMLDDESKKDAIKEMIRGIVGPRRYDSKN